MGCRTTDFLLSRSLRSPHTPPFIGLAPLAADKYQSAFEKSRTYLRGNPGRIRSLFHEFPYVSAWCVTQALSEAYGDADQAIYKHIEEAWGVSLERPDIRHDLYESFCGVCEKLGLPTRGFNRMVDVYLLHAGVPVAQLPNLIRAFLRQEAAFGSPPTQATAMLNRWEDDSLEFLPPAVITPRRAILWDETAWHAALYARIRENSNAFKAQNPIEESFRGALTDLLLGGGPTSTAEPGSAAIVLPKPLLVWRSDGLALRLPRVEGRIQLWQDEDASPLRLRGGEEWMLSQPWPRHLRWRVGEHVGDLYFLPTPTGFVIFDRATGFVVKEVGGSPSEIEVDSTDAVILSRCRFSLGGEPALEAGESVFIAFTRLGFSPVELATDQGVTRLRARPRRRLTLHGGLVANGPRGSLYGPIAMLQVETGIERSETRHLRITVQEVTADAEVAVIDGFAEVSVAALLSLLPDTIGLDPSRMRVDLLTPGDGAAPARRSGISVEVWVWPAFSRSDGFVFDSDPGPRNLVSEQSRHAALDSMGRLTLDHLGGYVAAQAVFEIEGAFIPFDLPWPDVVVVRRRADGSVVGLPMGTRLTVGEENRFDTVTIRCPDPLATLIVRGRREERPFARGLSRNLALRDLIEPASDDRVVLRRGNGFEVLLFELVPSMAPVSVRFPPSRQSVRLRLDLVGPVDALALEVQHERGESDFVEIGFGRRPVSSRRPPWLSADLLNGDPRKVELTVDASEFTDGLALGRILVRPDVEYEDQSTWRPLRNARGDTHAVALASSGLAAPDTDLQRRFETLSRWLADCYAIECWSEIEKTLMSRWQVLGRALAERSGGLGAVMIAAAMPPPDHTAPSWIPIAHPIQMMPHLYGAPTNSFAALAVSPDAGVAELAKMFSLGRTRLRDQSQLHVTVYLAFQNRHEAIERGVPLRGFEPHRFFCNLPLVDGDPSAGWFWRGAQILGPDHWRASHLRFVERLEIAGMFASEEGESGSNSRRERALHRLIRAAWEMTPESDRPPVPLRSEDREEPDNIDLWASSSLSAFARASRMGEVEEFVVVLGRRLDWSATEVLSTLALLLRLAPELFAFYLLTWQIAKERP